MKNDSRTELKSGYILFIIFIVFSLGIITTGFLYYKNYEKKYRTELEQQLSAVAELRVSQFIQWRRESLFAWRARLGKRQNW